MAVLALIPVDTQRTWFGLANALDRPLAGRPVLQHTLERAATVSQVDRIVLIHPDGQKPASLVDETAIKKPVDCFPVEGPLADEHTPHLRAARKWAMASWRGGLGESPVFDELLPPGPLHQACEAFHGTAALVARGEWCVFDPGLAESQLATHLEAPEALSVTFTQAPPGLTPLVCGASVLEQLATNQGSFGPILGYNPKKPRPDPISKDANIPIPASVRDCHHRFIADTERSMAMLTAIADELVDDLVRADAQAITDTARIVEASGGLDRFARLPQQATLELTPQREVAGAVVPQAYTSFDRPGLSTEQGERIIDELGAAGDVALMLGGLGDALLHPQWADFVERAHASGVLGIGLETDLRCDRATIDRLLELPVDLVVVRLNADQPDTYRETMGDGELPNVADNIRYFLEQRRGRAGSGDGWPGWPWLVPSLIKTHKTLEDLEHFFQRWCSTFACHPVIAPAPTGCGKMPDLSPVPMTPPDRGPCRQLGSRLSILSDGVVAQCDQDWHGEAALERTDKTSLLDAWQQLRGVDQLHRQGRYEELSLCSQCDRWHRP